MSKSHLLVINTHNRFIDFTRLMTHVKSFDYIFDSVLIISDSSIDYFFKVKQYVNDLFKGVDQLIEFVNLNNVGGASARNYIIEKNIYKKYDFISYCDDDDIPLKEKFISAEKYLEQNPNCIGYSCSYYRDYGLFGKNITFNKSKIYLNDIVKNNNIGGFSFVTLNTVFLDHSCLIPNELKSNQDWFLWIKLLFDNESNFFFKDSLVGLIYNDEKTKDRLTNKPHNIKSTYDFYILCKKKFDIELSSALSYFYYKVIKSLTFMNFVKIIFRNRKYLNIRTKHIVSLLKNFIVKII